MEYEDFDGDSFESMANYYDYGSDFLENLPPELLDQLTPEFLEDLQHTNPELFNQLLSSVQHVDPDGNIFALFDNYPAMVDQCLVPVFQSSAQIILPILFVSLICRFIQNFPIHWFIVNVLHIWFGVCLLYYYTSAAVFFVLLAILGYTFI